MTTDGDAVHAAAQAAVAPGPDGWATGKPDPLIGRRDGLLGAPVSRVDGAVKARGAARFAAEVPMAGMVYAALAYSTVAKGRIAALDTGAAEGAPGVVLVMTYRNAPRMKPLPALLSGAPKGAMGTSIRSCRTTGSTGTASRSRSCWPRPKSRRATPHR
jgi:xanthine dehydrogenase YagR molybdenum-binding subunit